VALKNPGLSRPLRVKNQAPDFLFVVKINRLWVIAVIVIGGFVKPITLWVLFLILGLVLFFATPFRSARADDNASDQQPAQLFMAQVKDKAIVTHEGKQHTANPPEALSEGDWIQTDSNNKAYLEFENGGVVEVGPNSRVQVKQLEITPKDFKARFLLAAGKFKAKVMKLTTASSCFEVQAGGVVAGVRGTVFGVNYDQADNQVSAATYEGSIFAQSNGRTETIDRGYGAVVENTGAPSVSELTKGQIQSFQQFDDVAGLLEEKKQELMDDMKNRALQAVPQVVPGQGDIQNAIGQKLGF
jgi:hypothetical protein